MRSKTASLPNTHSILTLILSLILVLAWHVTAHGYSRVTFGDNSADDFPGTVEDARIYNRPAYRTHNYGAEETFAVGFDTNSVRVSRTLIRFKDIALHLGANKEILGATMYLYCSGETDTPQDCNINAYRVLRNWVEGSSTGAEEDGAACWNSARFNDEDWETPGCGGPSDKSPAYEDTSFITEAGEYFSWDLTNAVQNWYDGTWSEDGVVLIHDCMLSHNEKTFESSESKSDGRCPFLEVTYRTKPSTNHAPALDWTDGGDFSDGVHPNTDNSGSTFEFRVKYTDEDNDPPADYRDVWIDLNDNGSYEDDEKFIMSSLGGSDYTAGVNYTKSKMIGHAGDGTLKFKFHFSDGEEEVYFPSSGDLTLTVTADYIINESFEATPPPTGYDEVWAETGAPNLNPDFLHPAPPSDAGLECLESISSVLTGYEASITHNCGSELTKTFTRFYLYVDSQNVPDGDKQRIGLAENASGQDVYRLSLYKNTSGVLKLELRLYNDGSWNTYRETIQTGTWYKVEVKYDTSESTSWEWRIDGVRQQSGGLDGAYRAGIQTWTLGFCLGSAEYEGTICFDLVAVDDDYWVEPGVETIHYVDADNTSPVAPYTKREEAANTIIEGTGQCSLGTVYVRRTPGEEYVEPIPMRHDVTVIGVDEWWNPTDPDDPRDGPTVHYDRPVQVQSSNCTLEGFTLKGGTGADALIKIVGSTGAVKNLTIRDCWLLNGASSGIRLDGAVSPIIEKCDIQDAGTGGIVVLMGTSYIFATGSPLIIRDNRLHGCAVGIRLNSSVTIGHDILMTIEGNDIFENKKAGIRLSNMLSGSDVTIDNNNIYNNLHAGIRIEHVALVTIKNNHLHDHLTTAGVIIGKDIAGASRVFIENNEIDYNLGGIIFRDGNSEPVDIRGNHIHHNTQGGIYIHKDIPGQLAGEVTITENDIDSNGYGGIGIKNGCRLIITKNEIHGSTGKGGIHTRAGSAGTYLEVGQNKIHHNQNADQGGGIDVRHASGKIYNNLVYRNGRGGIRFGNDISEIVHNTVVYNGNSAQSRGGGIIFDDRVAKVGGVTDPPEGTLSGNPIIRNNISVYNEKAGLRVGGNSEGASADCPDENPDCDIHGKCRNYNLLYSNNGTGETDCGWQAGSYVRSCVQKNYGGCGLTVLLPWELVNPNDIIADPLFKNMDEDNYRLKRMSEDGIDSPAIGAGDCDGSPCDMGAYGGSNAIDW